MTPELEAALREDIRRFQADPKKKCDDAYRDAQHVDLDTWRRVWREENDKAKAETPTT